MRLTLDWIRVIASGVLEWKEENRGIRLLRTTTEQRSIYGAKIPKRTLTMAGIKLDFWSNSKTLTLGCSDILLNPNYHCTFDVLIDGEFYSSFTICGEHPENMDSLPSAFCHTFRIPEGEKRITVHFPAYSMRLDLVELDDGATLEPYSHRCKWIAFGDSITEGREPMHPSNSYVCRLARRLDAEVYNQGISGEIFRSRKLVPGTYPKCDFVTVAYGTNDFRKQSKEMVRPEATAFLSQIVEEFSDVPIFYFLPLWRKDKGQITQGRTLEEVRALLREIAESFPQIIIIDCWDFIPHESVNFYDGYLHPNDTGFAFYAENLYRALMPHLTMLY